LETFAKESAVHNRIYVASIHPDIAEEDVRMVFAVFGNIKRIIMPAGTEGKGLHRCYGWIDFETASAANDALQNMNLFDLAGQLLRICRAQSIPEEVIAAVGATIALSHPLHKPQLAAAQAAARAVSDKSTTVPAATAAAPAIAAAATNHIIGPDLHSTQAAVKHGGSLEEDMSISGSSQRLMIMQKLARGDKLSTVVLLKNMVTVADVDDSLKDEIQEECSKHGVVRDVVIHIDRPRDGSFPDPKALAKVFVEYDDTSAAQKAIDALNGRFFAKRSIGASLYDVDKFRSGDYSG